MSDTPVERHPPGHSRVIRLVTFCWYAIGMLALSAAGRLWLHPQLLAAQRAAWSDGSVVLGVGEAVLGLFIIAALFVIARDLVREAYSAFVTTSQAGALVVTPSSRQFPAPATLAVGTWLLLLAASAVLGLLLVLRMADDSDFGGSLRMGLAATVGSCITTLLGFLDHACDKKDFDAAYIPWYVGRPLLGFLMGLVFYFVLLGGLVGLGVGPEVEETAVVAVGCLVGMFSKNAITRLHEVFKALFPDTASASASQGRTARERRPGT